MYSIWKFSILSLQLFCKFKTFLKEKVYILKKGKKFKWRYKTYYDTEWRPRYNKWRKSYKQHACYEPICVFKIYVHVFIHQKFRKTIHQNINLCMVELLVIFTTVFFIPFWIIWFCFSTKHWLHLTVLLITFIIRNKVILFWKKIGIQQRIKYSLAQNNMHL